MQNVDDQMGEVSGIVKCFIIHTVFTTVGEKGDDIVKTILISKATIKLLVLFPSNACGIITPNTYKVVSNVSTTF